MKDKTREIVIVIGFFIVLVIIAVNLAINNVVPKKFVCKDNIIAEQLEPVDIQTIGKDCFDKCEYEQVECLQLCTDMVKTLVEATQ